MCQTLRNNRFPKDVHELVGFNSHFGHKQRNTLNLIYGWYLFMRVQVKHLKSFAILFVENKFVAVNTGVSYFRSFSNCQLSKVQQLKWLFWRNVPFSEHALWTQGQQRSWSVITSLSQM